MTENYLVIKDQDVDNNTLQKRIKNLDIPIEIKSDGQSYYLYTLKEVESERNQS